MEEKKLNPEKKEEPVLKPCAYPGCPVMVEGKLCPLHRNYIPRDAWKISNKREVKR